MIRLDHGLMPSFLCFACGRRWLSANELRLHVHRCSTAAPDPKLHANPKPQETQP